MLPKQVSTNTKNNIVAIVFEMPQIWGVVPYAPYRVLFNTTQGSSNILSQMIKSIDEAILNKNSMHNATISVRTNKFPPVLPSFANENGNLSNLN